LRNADCKQLKCLKMVKSLEVAISDITEYKWKTTKDELLDAMRKEFVTKEFFEERLNTFNSSFFNAVRFHLLD
jgi:hypothetical protein